MRIPRDLVHAQLRLSYLTHLNSIKESHPDLDCVIFNSGIQRRSVFSEAEDINMDVIVQEMTVSYSPQQMTSKSVPFF